MTGSQFKLNWINFQSETDKYLKKDAAALSFVLEELDQYGYCETIDQGCTKIQRGIYRTNCLNSLDRTNILQTFIARILVHKWVGQTLSGQ